jgi:hypothetical protein
MESLTLVEAPIEVCSICETVMDTIDTPGPRRFVYECRECHNQKSSFTRITLVNGKNNRAHVGFLVGKSKPVYINHVLYHQLTLEISAESGADMCRDLSMRLAYGRKPQITLDIEDGRDRKNLIFLFNRGWMEDEQHTTVVLEEVGRSLFD